MQGRPISIWELRSPRILESYCKELAGFNFNPDTTKRVKELLPLDTQNLTIDKAITDWGQKVFDRLPSMRGKLLQDNGIPHPDLLEAIDQFAFKFLKPGFIEKLKALIPRGDICLAHNDAQEQNCLIKNADQQQLVLIDYEYGGWNPVAMDIANAFNEMTLDNNHAIAPGIKLYVENFPSKEERHFVYRTYLKEWHSLTA